MKKLTIFILLTICWASANATPKKQIGQWFAKSHFQTNMFCFRTYQCWPKSAIMYPPGLKLKKTENKLVQGVCITGGGALNKCECVTQAPIEQCNYWLE